VPAEPARLVPFPQQRQREHGSQRGAIAGSKEEEDGDERGGERSLDVQDGEGESGEPADCVGEEVDDDDAMAANRKATPFK
jgi:hypothetical protein